MPTPISENQKFHRTRAKSFASKASIIDDSSRDSTSDSDNQLPAATKEHQRQSPRNQCDEAQMARYRFLLGTTNLFRKFLDPKVVAQLDGRKDESALLSDEDAEDVYYTQSPPFIKGGELRDYQVAGLNWLISLYHNNINGILADEMGLGKTLQTISLISYLQECKGISGPHLFLAPKSTLQNWLNEFNRWTPDMKVFILHGTADERKQAIRDRLKGESLDFNVCITSYEICLLEKTSLGKIAWNFLVIDEAHRIKNEHSMLSEVVRVLSSEHRLLLTGTPLQNNLHELWALLNFLLPDVFHNVEDFDRCFSEGSDQGGTVSQLRSLLEPFLLRRLKREVEHSLLPKKEVYLYVPLSEMQRRWYQKILQKDISSLSNLAGKGITRTALLNIAMQLRKCCNHPYLFDGAEPGPPFTTDEHLVENSGKLQLLDKLLGKLRSNGSRVLIFSQMTRMLDVLEDYCFLRSFSYCRIDGSTGHQERVEAIEDFSKPDSDIFLFLLSTRAGGLGINLTAADVVIIYDSDWNPQVDLQAQDRAHRIGQTKQVVVFRFVSEHTIEEKVLERALQKLRLDQLVIQKDRAGSALGKTVSGNDLLSMIHHGASELLGETLDGSKQQQSLDSYLLKGEQRFRELQEKYENVGLEDLQRFSLISDVSSDSTRTRRDFLERKQELFKLTTNNGAMCDTLPSKRERRYTQLDENSLAKQQFNQRAPAPKPRFPTLHDFQFYPIHRLRELFEKETFALQRSLDYRVYIPVQSDDSARIAAAIAEQEKIDNAEPLTEADLLEKEALLAEGFSDWSRRDYVAFVKGCERYGRTNLQAIAGDIEGKTLDQVEAYSRAFWRRYRHLEDYDRVISNIERGESKLVRSIAIQRILSFKITSECGSLGSEETIHAEPAWRLLSFDTRNIQTGICSCFNDEEDKFLIFTLAFLSIRKNLLFGTSADGEIYEEIRSLIRNSPFFRFSWYFRTRSCSELQRRCTALITHLEKQSQNSALALGDPQKKRSNSLSTNSDPPSSLLQIGNLIDASPSLS